MADTFLKKLLLIDFRVREEVGEREKHQFGVPLIDAFTGGSLDVR